MLSTVNRQSSMMVVVHSIPCDAVASQLQLPSSRSNGQQPIETSQLERNRAQRIPSWPGEILSVKGRIHLRRPTRQLTFRLRKGGGPYIYSGAHTASLRRMVEGSASSTSRMMR